MPVLPRAAGRNEVGLAMLRALPRCDLLRPKLRPIITLHLAWDTTLGYQPLEHVENLTCRD
jgi:hypothetical protein